MPRVSLLLYQDDDGHIPLLDWMLKIPEKARLKCRHRLQRLQELGYELRRPEADLLRDEIYELRVGLNGIHYRMLYFFHGQSAVVVSHGIVKERTVPPKEIDRTVLRKIKFKADPQRYTYRDEVD